MKPRPILDFVIGFVAALVPPAAFWLLALAALRVFAP